MGRRNKPSIINNKVIEKLDTKDSRSETEIKIRIFTRLRAARDNESLLSFPSRERDW